MTLRVTPDEIVAADNSGLLGIHPTWERIRLGDVARVQNGYPFPSSGFSQDKGVPLLRIRDVGTDAPNTYFDGQVDAEFIVSAGDIVVGMDGDFRAARWRGDPAALNQRVCRIIPASEHINHRFLFSCLQPYLDAVNKATSAVTVKHLSSKTVQDLPLPLPPLPEQERIVAAIEEAFSLLDAGEAGLHDTRKRLKRMRDSVLTAAVTGQLVPQHPTDTPAAEWLASQGVGDAAAADDRLPASWSRVRLGDVAEVKLGRQRSPARASGPRMRPYLRAANVGWNGLKLDDVKEMDFTESESAGFELVPGDLLLSEASGSPGEVGKPGQYRGEIEGCCFQNTLIRVRLRAGWNPDFYEHYFRQQALAGEFAKGSRGVGIHHLGRKALSDWLTPVPPPEEQARIVAEVERLFSFIEAAERAVGAGLARSAGLRRSVLQSAFEGRLVEQDPADEPASALLERIAAERVAVPRGRAPRRARGKVEAS
jgi:type I restriction enzyme S subunit